MQRHIFAAAVLIFIMSFAVGGVTAAYFTDGITLPLAEFTAGTVEVEVDEVSNGDTIKFDGGYSGTVKWKITNVGSKRAHLRVKPYWNLDGESGGGDDDGNPSAWAVDKEIVGKKGGSTDICKPVRSPGPPAMYIIYNLNTYTKNQPLELVLGRNNDYRHSGTVDIWDDGSFIYVHVETNPEWILEDKHLYVGTVPPPFPLAYGTIWNKKPFDFSDTHVSYKVSIPDRVIDGKVYIGFHAELIPNPESGGGSGDGGTPEIYISIDPASGWVINTDGYYYYCGGSENGVVKSGAKVPFKISFVVDAEEGWSGCCKFWIEVEAVQASNGAINYVWPGNPIDD